MREKSGPNIFCGNVTTSLSAGCCLLVCGRNTTKGSTSCSSEARQTVVVAATSLLCFGFLLRGRHNSPSATSPYNPEEQIKHSSVGSVSNLCRTYLPAEGREKEKREAVEAADQKRQSRNATRGSSNGVRLHTSNADKKKLAVGGTCTPTAATRGGPTNRIENPPPPT